MKTSILSVWIFLSASFATAEMVEEEVITLDPSGMVHRSKVMVEKKAAPEKKAAGGEKTGAARDQAEEAVPFLTEERVTRFTRFKDCWVDDGRICLKREPVQGADGCVVLEAEEGKSVQPEEGRVAVGFDEADGCRYVAYLNRAEYLFEVKTDGAYQSWHRCWFPVRGNWSQSETLDREPTRGVLDSPDGKQPDKEWVWAKGPVYNLAAGTHRLVIDYHAGARLDKIVLAPAAWEPKGKGPAASYTDPVSAARVETVALSPLAIEKWYRLNLNALGGGGQVDAQYSLDGGQTWKPVPAKGDLKAIGAGPEGGRELKVAFELKSSAQGVTPILMGPVVKFVGAQPLALGNDQVQIQFSRSKGSIVGIRNQRTRQECMVAGSQTCPLVDLNILKDKALKGCPEPILKAQAVEEGKNGKVLTQKYQWFEGKIEASVTVTLGKDGKAVFNLAVNNRGEDPIVHVDFPRLAGLRIGAKGADNYFCIPMLMGSNLYRDPGNSPRLWNYTQQYPWSNPMKWVDLWNSSGGLYVASHDATFRDTAMLVGGTPEDSISLLFRKLVHVAPGKDWTSQPYSVVTHPGDWHWAAREYAAWARTCIKPPDNPRWFREEFDGFIAGPAYGAFPYNGFMNARRVVGENPTGEQLVDVAANRQGFDALAGYCTLYPYPNPAWGGAEEFSQACDMIRQMGGHSIWYINWLLINSGVNQPRIGAIARKLLPPDALPPDRAWVESASARDPAGNNVYKNAPPDVPYDEHRLCDETAEFSKYKVSWAERYVKDFHADGIYWDCLLYSYGCPCYQPAHHVNGDLGHWGNASMETLRKMIEVTRASNPHAFYMGEGMCIAGVSQYENLPAGSVNSEVYRYTFPDWVLGGGSGGGRAFLRKRPWII